MEALMKFEDVAELLSLDRRDEKRNKMLFGAVCEKICMYLDRNLFLGVLTETIRTDDRILDLKEFPVREILEMKDADTGESISLLPNSLLLDISRPDAHKFKVFEIDSTTDRNLRITYRYGYSLEEMPMLIKSKIVEMTKIFIAFSTTDSLEDTANCCVNRLDEINVYRRTNRL